MSESLSYVQAPNLRIEAGSGVNFSYRRLGAEGAQPLLLLQHFRGNLDYWDAALIDRLAKPRQVIAFDNVGVGGTTGRTPSSISQMARDALTFVDALGLDSVDLLGFSIGSFVAQEIAMIRPNLVRRLVLASSAPRGASGMHGWAPPIIEAVGKQQPGPQDVLRAFYTTSAASQQAGQESLGRIFGLRTEDRDAETSWQTRCAQYDAVCEWGIPDHSALARVGTITQPTFVANGDSDEMILPRYSHLLAGLLPDASVKIYPDSAHGFLFQHSAEFAADVNAFLSSEAQATS